MPLRSFDDLIDEHYPPGSPERAAFDAYGAAYRRRMDRVCTLTSWMRFIPPRWEYTEPEIIEGVTYRFHHGVGHIAMCFWGDMLESLTEEAYGRGPAGRLKSAFYGALDGLAFHYLDDAYVPTLTDVFAGRAGGRMADWRRRRRAAIARAQQNLAELRAEGYFQEGSEA